MSFFEIIPHLHPFSSQDIDNLKSSETNECPICLEDNSQSTFILLKECQHQFCLDCFKQHLHTTIQGRKVLKISCPQSNCSHILPAELLERVLDAPEFDKYKEIVLQKTNARVSQNSFCPKPGCSRPYTKTRNTKHTTCTCGMIICNQCGRESHEGKDCLDALDRSFEAFVQENDLKICIMCKTVVEKMEGCSHITCPVCDYEWCWLCGQEHSQNHGLKCTGKWNPLPPKKIVQENEPNTWKKSAKNILRLIFFILSLPLRLALWPCFSINIYAEVRDPQKTTREKLKIVLAFILIVVIQESIVGLDLWFIIRYANTNPVPVGIFTGLVIVVLILQVWFAKRLTAVPVGRWESRNSNIFRFNKSARVHPENEPERQQVRANPQQAEQAQAAEDLEGQPKSVSAGNNIAQNDIIEIRT